MILFRNFFRHVRDGLRNLFRNGWMTMASILTMALTLFMISGLIILMGNVQKVTRDMEKGIQIHAYIDLAANEQDEANLYHEIEAIDHVKKITYRSKDQELQDLIKTMGKDFDLFEKDKNPLHNVYLVDVDKPEFVKPVTEQIANLKYISDAKNGGMNTEKLFKSINVVRYVMALVAAVFVIIAVLLISNTIRLTIYARRHEIEIMRLVGAKNGFIRAPFQIEGTLIGIIGAGLAFGALYAVYEGIQTAAPRQFGIQNLALLPTWPLFWYVLAIMLVVGTLLGFVGARRSMSKFLQV
ncbi:permease-like cell division protein FtsX [Vaginisenegalia massiliensis]|uniref:permease-like cell division protein FtsX n=1 Tax=Vaginisenegalia massiliensis TaxID=2058294 RepID=UPI001F1527EC|nr:permease-like cell division protein FtsX [Vaginisenegalia massiliensis]